MATGPSDKSRGVALILALFLGVVGGHRYYTGKIGTGLLMLCTMGGFGIWALYDVIIIAAGQFRDADGHRLALWDPGEEMTELDRLPPAVLDELEALRREVDDLHERVDFTERLLSQPGSERSTFPGSNPRY